VCVQELEAMRHELHAEACRSVAVQRRGKEIEATLCSASLYT
jgi:hypothetical protein